MSKLSFFKQFSFVKVHSLVLFDPQIGHLSSANTPGQSGPRSKGNEGVLHIPQSSNITGTLPSDCFVSYPGHLMRGSLTPQQRCSQCIRQPQPAGQTRNYCSCYKINFRKKVWFGLVWFGFFVLWHDLFNGKSILAEVW